MVTVMATDPTQMTLPPSLKSFQAQFRYIGYLLSSLMLHCIVNMTTESFEIWIFIGIVVIIIIIP